MATQPKPPARKIQPAPAAPVPKQPEPPPMLDLQQAPLDAKPLEGGRPPPIAGTENYPTIDELMIDGTIRRKPFAAPRRFV